VIKFTKVNIDALLDWEGMLINLISNCFIGLSIVTHLAILETGTKIKEAYYGLRKSIGTCMGDFLALEGTMDIRFPGQPRSGRGTEQYELIPI
jgi:hypothetical protein